MVRRVAANNSAALAVLPLTRQTIGRLTALSASLPVSYTHLDVYKRQVLNGTDHLRGVGVLVVVPRHDLNLIGVVVDLSDHGLGLSLIHI